MDRKIRIENKFWNGDTRGHRWGTARFGVHVSLYHSRITICAKKHILMSNEDLQAPAATPIGNQLESSRKFPINQLESNWKMSAWSILNPSGF